MAELITHLQEIKQLPPDVHLLCPKQSDEDPVRYEEETNEEVVRTVSEAKSRRKKFISSMQLLAFDGAESEQYQRYIWDRLDDALGKCDVCIREYYLAKLDLLQELREDYEDHDIKNFFSLIDRRDIQRITTGLSAVTATLNALPIQKRNTRALEQVHLHAIFEALVCRAFLLDEGLVQQHFDEAFGLVQTKRPLRIQQYLPAVTRFLFDDDSKRFQWAYDQWTFINRPPTDIEWAWAMKDLLQSQLRESTTPKTIIRLWKALQIITLKLDSKQITHNLFELVPSITTTALNHLAKPTQAVPCITQTMKNILEKAPEAFWQSMGSISSSTIVEQVFASPYYDRILQETTSSSTEEVPRSHLLTWIPPLIHSLKPANRTPVCQTLVVQLFERIRSNQITIAAKQACFEMAIHVLLLTIKSFSDDTKTRQSVERVVLSDTLNIISCWIDEVLNPAQLKSIGIPKDAVRANVLALVRNALALECQCLKDDFEALSSDDVSHREQSSYSPEIWKACLENLNEDDVALSSALLLGITQLPGQEQFRSKDPNSLSKEKQSYNDIFGKITGMVSKILERLAEFNPSHLDEMFKKEDTSMSLMATLFSADTNTYLSAVDLIKNISGQSGRKEALGHLLDAFLSNTLFGVCWTFRRIWSMSTFSSVPRMLKTGMDILDALCNQEDGILRSRKFDHHDAGSIKTYWFYQWNALRTVFRQTERWAEEVRDKPLMTEVCRDAMQYAEALFEQYDLFAGVIAAASEHPEEVPKSLLEYSNSQCSSPVKTLKAMARWLRLRDQYLADTLVKLIEKMLSRLKKSNAVVENDELSYVEEVATKTTIRTILSDSQKAVLARALEQYYGKRFTRDIPQKKKQSRLTEWADSTTQDQDGIRKSTSRTQSIDEFEDGGISDRDFYEILSGKSLEIQKAGAAAKIAAKAEDSKKGVVKTEPSKPKVLVPSAQSIAAKKALEAKAFIENRKRETEAAKLRAKEAAARLRGQHGIGQHTIAQGSGVKGIGVKGKDHASGPNSMMVSSESESDSEDSDDEALFGSSVKTLKPVEAQAMGLAPKAAPLKGPVRKTKQQRSQKDMRARLTPDLSALHKTILAWDFFTDTDLPPNSMRDDYTLVTNTFKTASDYQATFGPLLVLEGWQSFRSAREDGTFRSFEIKVSNTLIVDQFVEINTTIPLAPRKEDQLGINVADIVLLSKSKNADRSPDQPHCLARVKEVSRKKMDLQIVYRINATNNSLRPFLNDKAVIWGAQILSLTPLEREYGALMALPYYDLCDEIVRAKPSPLLDYPANVLREIENVYDVNQAQAKAVKSALDNDAFTLIQGPPGSGKTKTICALVGAMMTGSLKSGNSVETRLSLNGSARGPQPALPPAAKKLLVCAPSNAAVDELVMRFKNGVKLMNGSTEKLSIVRLGRSDAINANVKDVTLEELVNARLNLAAPREKQDIQEVMMAHKATCEEVNALREKMNESRSKGQPVTQDENIFDLLQVKKRQLASRIDEIRESQNSATRDADLNRRRVQQQILDSAHVLCATLSGSGHEIFQGLNVEFETVIIDEAAQSIELSALIPLKYGCSKCILVGDPKQLPPTVLSREAARFQYEQSLFARMENNHRKDVHLLDTQYRMHPEISLFPSRTFYDSRLKDGEGMAKLRARPWHHSNVLAPYRFFDVQGMSSAAPKGHSLVNVAEINVAMQLYERITTDVRNYDFTNKIGIITPYKGQLRALKDHFSSKYGSGITSAIEFNTTDAFQGRESDIIIFSCVRASSNGIGFLNDIRRMNVGLTRAKCSLWVLGNSQSLMQGEFWRALVNDAKTRNLLTDGDILNLLRKPLLTEDMMRSDVEMVDVDALSLPMQRKVSTTPLPPTRPSAVQAENGDKAILDQKASLSQNVTPLPSRPNTLSSRASSNGSVPRIEEIDVLGKPSSSRVLEPATVKSEIRTGESRQPSKSNPDGPSGGRLGLNDKALCNRCGSHTHFTHKCDNVSAHAASLGVCARCQQPGHTKDFCTTTRCSECGEFGHHGRDCTAPPQRRLSSAEKENLKRQESRFREARERAREKRAEKQLGEHGAKIPDVKSTLASSNGSVKSTNDGAKRKRDNQSSIDTPKESKAIKMSDDIIETGSSHKRGVDSSASSVGEISRASTPQTSSGGLAGGTLPPRAPARLGPGATPLVKKKKKRDDDLFMKRK